MRHPPVLGPLGLAAAALLAAVGAQAVLAQRPPSDVNEVLYLPNPGVARHLDLGLGEAWADWMHLQALLYVVADFDLDSADKEATRLALERGERPPERPPRYVWLSQLYDAITELDPHFLEAYLYGARFLALLQRGDPKAPDSGPQRALALLRKAASPERLGHRWEVWHELGMVHYMDLHDTPAALRALTRATALPDCPPLVAGFVARLAEGTEHDIEVYDHLQARLRDAREAGDSLMERALGERAAEHLARTVWKELQRAAEAHAAAGAPAPELAALARGHLHGGRRVLVRPRGQRRRVAAPRPRRGGPAPPQSRGGGGALPAAARALARGAGRDSRRPSGRAAGDPPPPERRVDVDLRGGHRRRGQRPRALAREPGSLECPRPAP